MSVVPWKKLTALIPTLSEAVAEIVTVSETVEPEAGAVRVTVGGTVSAFATVTVMSKDVV
jgi:hypothetical protein